MANKKYLIDTNVIIDYIGGILPPNAVGLLEENLDNDISISVINRIEILGFSPKNPDDLIPFEEFAELVIAYPLSLAIENETINLRKKYKIQLPDAIIAATAIVHGLILVSRNEKDFTRIPNIKIINPHNL